MDIHVFFAGLMLICLQGQANCPQEDGKNTAWVVKADGVSKPCGWDRKEKTTLEVEYRTEAFTAEEFIDNDRLCRREDGKTICKLDEVKDLCLVPQRTNQQDVSRKVRQIPHIDVISKPPGDGTSGSYFKEWNAVQLNDRRLVPNRISFDDGRIKRLFIWPKKGVRPNWSRSKGGRSGLPRNLSDRLKAIYHADTIDLDDCGKGDFKLKLRPEVRDAKITFRNRADQVEFDQPIAGFDELTYLLWYYRLGSWNTHSGECPTYSHHTKDAVLLRCKREFPNEKCAYDIQSTSVFWPVMMGPG